MSNERVIFLVRGLPGSGRTTAIERVRANFPGLVFVDADPAGVGDEFSDLSAHQDSIRRAAEDIRGLVKHGVDTIAVETCAPLAQDVDRLLDDARGAGYLVEELSPAGYDPLDVISCFENSSHRPDPDFLADLVQRWQPVELNPAPRFNVVAQKRAAAFREFLKAMAAATFDDAQVGVAQVHARFPAEAANLQLDSGPIWGRHQIERAPSFPLAPVSEYWADMQRRTHGEPMQSRPKLILPTPAVLSPGLARS